MSGPFKLKYNNSAFPFKIEESKSDITANVKGLKYNPPKQSKLKTGSFAEGSGGKGSHKIILGGEIGYKGKFGSVSLKPTIISERGKYHSFTKPDIKIGLSTTFQNIKTLFKNK